MWHGKLAAGWQWWSPGKHAQVAEPRGTCLRLERQSGLQARTGLLRCRPRVQDLSAHHDTPRKQFCVLQAFPAWPCSLKERGGRDLFSHALWLCFGDVSCQLLNTARVPSCHPSLPGFMREGLVFASRSKSEIEHCSECRESFLKLKRSILLH